MVSQQDFWTAIDNAPGDSFLTTHVIDWGPMPRGAGKRSGRMIMGAMSGAVRGKKSYSDILGSAPINEEERAEANPMEPAQKLLFARALKAGHSADVAFLVSYTIGADSISRKEAYDLSVEKIVEKG